jgi:hypothetical protein
MAYSKTTTITYSFMKSAYDNGYSLHIFCGNNNNDKIQDTGTVMQAVTGSLPTYTYRKAWLVPRTEVDGQGATLEEMLEYMKLHSLTQATYKVSNPSVDKIVHVKTGAEFITGVQSYNNWIEDDD